GPVAARPAVAPPPVERVVEQRAAAPASRPAGQAESGALIGEEDLPAWLRAWEANASTAKQSATADADNQEWMLGSEPAAAPARVSRRAGARRRRGLTPATLVLIVAAIFFLIALGFFLFTVGPFH